MASSAAAVTTPGFTGGSRPVRGQVQGCHANQHRPAGRGCYVLCPVGWLAYERVHESEVLNGRAAHRFAFIFALTVASIVSAPVRT